MLSDAGPSSGDGISAMFNAGNRSVNWKNLFVLHNHF